LAGGFAVSSVFAASILLVVAAATRMWTQEREAVEPETEGGASAGLVSRGAPTLYAIIGLKLLSALFCITVATGIRGLVGKDPLVAISRLVLSLGISPEHPIFFTVARQILNLGRPSMLWGTVGILGLGLLALAEGVGLMVRAGWAGWLAIVESLFFIPINFADMARTSSREPSFSAPFSLAVNILIVWYLFENRRRLFTRRAVTRRG
jgi:uncharacterized membrane protein (DUF2068 family)